MESAVSIGCTLILSIVYSMRILPHHQDTGGFFVAVLEKMKSLPWESEANTVNQSMQNSGDNEKEDKPNLEDENASDAKFSENKKRILEEDKKLRESQRKRRRIVGYREDPFVFFKDETEDVWQSIK